MVDVEIEIEHETVNQEVQSANHQLYKASFVARDLMRAREKSVVKQNHIPQLVEHDGDHRQNGVPNHDVHRIQMCRIMMFTVSKCAES